MGDVPEEANVDQRVEPQTWLAGDATAARSPVDMDQPGLPSEAVAGDIYGNGSAAEAQSGSLSELDDQYPPPYPAQLPTPPPARLAGRVTAPFAGLAKKRPRLRARARGMREVRSAGPSLATDLPPAGDLSQVTDLSPAADLPRVTDLPPAADVHPADLPSAEPYGRGWPEPHAARVAVAARPRSTRAVTRRAQLVVSRIEPWSVMKFSFMVSLVAWVVMFVAVAVLYFVLSRLGVFHAIQSTISSVTSSKGSTGADAGGGWFSASRILGYTMLIGAINVVLFTALATIGAVIYNLVTHLAGGIEVTLRETD
jgi:hypothetical protein